jgi:3-oxoacyl-[acyl-carrier-protein] synthase II
MIVYQGPEGPVSGRRVAITGVGVVAAPGIGRDAFWAGLMQPQVSDVRRVPDFDPVAWMTPKEAHRADRFAQFAVAAATMAVADAGAADGYELEVDPDRAGVVIGTGTGGVTTMEAEVLMAQERGLRRVSPVLVPMIMPNAPAAAVSMRFGWQGPCECVVTACAAGSHSIANAARLVASGRCDVMLAGATEAPCAETVLAAFKNMTALTRSGVARPFDARRDGFVMGEGAAVLLLEEWGRATARGARILAELAGAAGTADAHHLTAPSPGGAGAIACMQLALADAGIDPADVGHVNAHGTATPLNDLVEAEAIAKVFGLPGPPVTSIKAVTGHTFGAAGAIEAAASVLSIEHGLIPPTAGCESLDPGVLVDVVAGAPRPWEPGPVVSNSFGFGGHNGCLVITPPQ